MSRTSSDSGVRRLLVVDDEPHIGLLLRPQFEALGYHVTLARTLAEARAAITPAPDFLLLDLHLPDGSGLDFLAEVRAAPATRHLPVLILTADGEDRAAERAGVLSASMFTKPFSPSKLVARVSALLGDPGLASEPRP
ncbi:MAG TPA: response regulator transcription factor [Gemmatimonadales bacterium]|nr:response regulator transcription factor [Gemmatimonadales bacterium]